jgi:ParB family chromosome partitioning protein
VLFGDDEEKYFYCDLGSIIPNKHQPRVYCKEDELSGLADSIKENGIIQPLIVTGTERNGVYELVAGERRLRASKIAGLKQVPVVVRDVENEDTLLELALIENVQRTDLNPIEEAQAYRNLIDKFSYTQDETAKRVGKQRSTITNMLRLLKLPEHIQEDIINRILTEGHGRALIKLVDDPLLMQEVRNNIVKNSLSVRQTEKMIRKLTNSQSRSVKSQQNIAKDELPESYKKALITQLTNRLNSKVNINQNGNRGKIEVEYYSLDDLERLIGLLVSEK